MRGLASDSIKIILKCFHRRTLMSFVIDKLNTSASLLRLALCLKWYYDQKITFIFSSNFETLFTKHSPSEILSVNFDKKTVYLNCNFPIYSPPLLHQKGQNDIIHTRVLECSVCESALFSMQHGSFELSHSQTCVLHNL